MKETQAFIRKLKSENRVSNFDLVKSFISAMSSTEIRFTKHYLKMLHNAEFETLPLQLFRYIQGNPSTPESEARMDFQKMNTGASFDKAVSILKKRLSWSLVSEYNTQREDSNYSYKWRILFEIRNNISLYYILKSRQLSGYAFDVLNETIEKGKEIEAFGELVNALELKIRHIKARSENRQMIRLEKDLVYYRNCEKAIIEADRIYYHVATLTRKQSVSDDELMNSYQQGLNQLKELYRQFKVDSILDHCLFVEASIFQLHKDYISSGKLLQKQYDLVRKSPVLNDRPNMGKCAAFLADNHIRNFNFEIAAMFCKKAKSYFEANSFNYFQIEFLEYHTLFYTNKFYQAEQKMLGILNNPNYRESEFLINTKKYLVACALFAQGKYNDALTLLNGLEKVWNDPTGWSVGIKTLIILCYKMLGNYELMAVERDRFRWLFDKYRHRVTIRERDRIILKIIYEFLKPNSDFKTILKRKKTLLDKLGTSGYEWKVLSHEMIIFEQWFMCMVNRTPFRIEVNFVEGKK